MLKHTFLTANAKTKPYYCIWERKMKSKFWRSWQQRQQQLKPFYDSERNGNGLVEERILSSNTSNSVTCKTSFIAFANLFKPHTALHHYMMHDWTEEDFNYIAMIYLWGPQTTIINWRLKTFELKTKDCVDKMTYVITFFLIVEYIL